MPQLSSEKPELFKGRHFNHLLIIQAVRWYVTYKLSYRDVCDLMAERGVTVVHTTVLRWFQCFVPVFAKMWKKYARPVSSSWRVDETYIKVKGQWRYLYLSVPKMPSEIFKPEFQVDEFNFDSSFGNSDNSASQSFGQGRHL